MLDLDNISSSKELTNKYFNNSSIVTTIQNSIKIVKQFGDYCGIIISETDIQQYKLNIKYFEQIILTAFEFDDSNQFINIIVYNNSKILLKISLKINDDPIISYIENDKSGFIKSIDKNSIKIKPGEYLINFAHCLLSFVGITRVRLDDDSHLIIQSNNTTYNVKLWLYLLLTKGHSWYIKFGYESINISDLHFAINDVKNINLNDIITQLELAINLKKDLDFFFVETSRKIIDLINFSNANTLEKFVSSQTIELFSELTNNLSQSIYANGITCGNIFIEFPWHQKIHYLFITNVMQVNNCIANHYFKF